MKKFFLVALLFGVCNANAQDSTLRSKKWQAYFSDYTKEEYVDFLSADFDKKFTVRGIGQIYHCLLVFKDSTKSPIELKVRFTSIEDLCDPKKNIEGDNADNTYKSYSFDKKDLKFFIYHDIPFVFNGIVRKKYKIESTPQYWSVVLIDGPVRYTKYYYTMTSGSGKLQMDVGTIQKGEENIGTGVKTMGNFGFKKFAVKTFSDDAELAQKIQNEEAGYKKQDGLKIISEYNAWALQTDPNAFKKSMIFGNLIMGPIR